MTVSIEAPGSRWNAPVALRLVLAACFAAGCSGEQVIGDYPVSTCDLSEPSLEHTGSDLTVATFWVDEKESAAFRVLWDRVDQQRYNFALKPRDDRRAVQTDIRTFVASNELPDLFQANGGSDVLRWAGGAGSGDSALCPVDPLRRRYGWDQVYFTAALEPLLCQGRLFGLPVGIHRLNLLLFNDSVFEVLEREGDARGLPIVRPPELSSVDELVAQLDQIAELGSSTSDGQPLLPLALGSDLSWPLTILAFENVLVSLDPTTYERVWMGGLEGAAPEGIEEVRQTLQQMFDRLRAMVGRSNVAAQAAGAPALSWQESVRAVAQGRAAMTVMGDWAWAQLDDAERQNVVAIPFPGTAGTFVYTPDSFSVPRGDWGSGVPAHYWLHEIIEDKSALLEFSRAKHAIPPRRDLDQSEIDGLAPDTLRSTYLEFSACQQSPDCRLLLAVSGLGPPPAEDFCFDELDSLLAFALSGFVFEEDADDDTLARRCERSFAATPQEAEDSVIALLLEVAGRRFAAECRQ